MDGDEVREKLLSSRRGVRVDPGRRAGRVVHPFSSGVFHQRFRVKRATSTMRLATPTGSEPGQLPRDRRGRPRLRKRCRTPSSATWIDLTTRLPVRPGLPSIKLEDVPEIWEKLESVGVTWSSAATRCRHIRQSGRRQDADGDRQFSNGSRRSMATTTSVTCPEVQHQYLRDARGRRDTRSTTSDSNPRRSTAGRSASTCASAAGSGDPASPARWTFFRPGRGVRRRPAGSSNCTTTTATGSSAHEPLALRRRSRHRVDPRPAH